MLESLSDFPPPPSMQARSPAFFLSLFCTLSPGIREKGGREVCVCVVHTYIRTYVIKKEEEEEEAAAFPSLSLSLLLKEEGVELDSLSLLVRASSTSTKNLSKDATQT